VKSHFNPLEKRDGHGRWTKGGAGAGITPGGVSSVQKGGPPAQVLGHKAPSTPEGAASVKQTVHFHPTVRRELADAPNYIGAVHRVPTDGAQVLVKQGPMANPGAMAETRLHRTGSDFMDPGHMAGITLSPEVVAAGPPEARAEFYHEFGHVMDRHVLGGEGFGSDVERSEDDPEMWQWFRAVEGSRRFREFRADADKGVLNVTGPDGKPRQLDVPADGGAHPTFDYLTSPHEAFARSYAQWIAQRSGDQEALERLQGDGHSDQWDDDDFKPIAAALDNLFAARGLGGKTGRHPPAGPPAHAATLGVTPARGDDPNVDAVYSTPKFKMFERRARAVAPTYGVTVEGMERNRGVYQGGGERSYALKVHDGEDGVRGYAADLGKSFNQDAVGSFTEDPNADGVRYQMTGLADPDAAAGLAAERLGFANLAGDTLEFWGTSEDLEKVQGLAQELGVRADATPGQVEFIDRESYDGAIEKGIRHAEGTRAAQAL
jgi:hypothetical protein